MLFRSDERLQDYLSRAGRKVDSRMTRMAQARDRLNKGYEIYHAETPNKVVDRFDANTPALAQRYYNNFIANYQSDVDYDLRLRRGTGIIEGKFDANPATYDLPRRPLNVPELIKRGAIFITEPHGPNGWEPDAEGFSLVTLYNVMKGGWPVESKQHLKPSMYNVAATGLNRQGPGTMLYDGKYNQILWSIKKLGIPEEVAFLDKQEIKEAFDQPYPIKWEKSEHGDYDALATLGDGTYLSIMFNNEGDDEYQIEFHRNNSQAVTGEGDAQRVFATVLDAIQQFLKVEQPWKFIFSASKDRKSTRLNSSHT